MKDRDIPRGSGEDAEDELRAAAREGDSGAAARLGALLVRADRVAEGEAWLRRSAEAGDPDAVGLVGLALLDTLRVDEAEEWLREAARAGHTRSAMRLGALLQVRGRADEAERFLRTAVAEDDRYAMAALGILLLVRGDTADGNRWLYRAQSPAAGPSGDPREAGIPPYPAESARWGHGGLMLDLGRTAAAFGHHQAAANWIRMAALGGDSEAMHRFGVILHGHGRPRTAEPWLRRVAEAGEPPAAMNSLGLVLIGLDRAAEGEEWLERGAAAGDPEAMRNHATVLYAAGREKEARKWHRRAEKAARKAGAGAP